MTQISYKKKINLISQSQRVINIVFYSELNFFYINLEKCILNFIQQRELILQKSSIGNPDQITFNNEDVFSLEILGKGGFGTVQKVYHKVIGKYVALKFFNETSTVEEEEQQLEQIKLEDYLLRKVEEISKREPNYYFLKYYGVFEDPKKEQKEGEKRCSSIILQMESGIATLDDILRAGKEYNGEEILYVLKRLIYGFAILQENGIAQRDVKAENVILVEDENDSNQFLYKISDFGIGCEISSKNDEITCQSITGISEKYVAPEVLKLWKKLEEDPDYQESYNPFLSDVYSLGIVFLKMLKFTLGKKDLKQNLSDLFKKHGFFKENKTLILILDHMIQEDPKKRMDFKNLSALIKKIEKTDDKINFDLKPTEEFHFFELSRAEKEKKRGATINGLKDLYEEHKQLFQNYNESVNKLNQAKYHLDRAWAIYEDSKNMDAQFSPEEEIFLLNQSCNLFHKLRFLDDAEQFSQKSLKLCEKLYPDNQNHMYFAITYSNIGMLNWEKNQFDLAEQNISKALEIDQNLKGEDCIETAQCYNLLGTIYLKKDDFLKAEEFFKKCLKIREKIFQEIHFHVAQSYNNLGLLYRQMQDYKKSEEFYLKSLAICKKLYGENHLLVSNACHQLGKLYLKMDIPKKTEEFYLKNLEICQNFYGEFDQATSKAYHKLGNLYYKMKEIDKSNEFIRKSEEITKKLKLKSNVKKEKEEKEWIMYKSCCYNDAD